MNKYYTPTIDEFYVGFEYEWNNSNEDNEWRSSIANVEDCYYAVRDIEQYIDYNNYRVKYLDKEDIESLGWKFIGKTIDNWYELVIDRPAVMSAYTNSRYVLQHDFRTNQGVVIMAYDYSSGETGEHDIYRGSCKNKSELKKLLKQLKIID